jgi:hypothetical protein
MSLFEFRQKSPFKLDTLEECSIAIEFCRNAMPTVGFTEALKVNEIPILDLWGYQMVAETLTNALQRVSTIMTETLDAMEKPHG